MLGDLLRQTREQKNLSLDDAEKGTNIRKLYIKAIEDGNYDKLPGEVFLKGFIKTYGKFLGLDGQKLIEQYKEEKSGTTVLATEENQIDIQKQNHSAETNAEISPAEEKKINQAVNSSSVNKQPTKSVPNIDNFGESQKYLKMENSSGNKKNIFIIICIIIIIVIGAVAFLSSQGSDSQPEKDNQTKTEQVQTQQQQPKQPSPAPVPVSGSEVSAAFTQDCWTEVKVDGSTVLSETVKAGSSLNWKGNSLIEITVGNAGAVDITFNGQPQGKMGDVGAVVTKSFAAPDLAQTQSDQTSANNPVQQPAAQQQNQ